MAVQGRRDERPTEGNPRKAAVVEKAQYSLTVEFCGQSFAQFDLLIDGFLRSVIFVLILLGLELDSLRLHFNPTLRSDKPGGVLGSVSPSVGIPVH